MTRSQELYDQWIENGGDMKETADKYLQDVENEMGYVTWHPSHLVRWSNVKNTNPPFPKRSEVSEKLEDPIEEQETVSRIRWKHKWTDTWMHIRSSTRRIVGAPVGFEAWVTIEGQQLTIGENKVSTDKEEVFEWAIEWMENNPDVDEYYD